MVGGHSNTFLYTGNPHEQEIEKSIKQRGAFEKPEDVYPYIVKRSGKDVLVVSAYKYSKYLGYLKLRVENGKVIPFESSNPILLDNTYKQGKYNTVPFSVDAITNQKITQFIIYIYLSHFY